MCIYVCVRASARGLSRVWLCWHARGGRARAMGGHAAHGLWPQDAACREGNLPSTCSTSTLTSPSPPTTLTRLHTHPHSPPPPPSLTSNTTLTHPSTTTLTHLHHHPHSPLHHPHSPFTTTLTHPSTTLTCSMSTTLSTSGIKGPAPRLPLLLLENALLMCGGRGAGGTWRVTTPSGVARAREYR